MTDAEHRVHRRRLLRERLEKLKESTAAKSRMAWLLNSLARVPAAADHDVEPRDGEFPPLAAGAVLWKTTLSTQCWQCGSS